ncbi:MAG: hypothetical protein HPY55_00975 [Firmicutes bacterium]|nr:hypothetical protein [Bacillota bacterium]
MRTRRRENRIALALVLALLVGIAGLSPAPAWAAPALELHHVLVDGKPLAPGALAERSWLSIMLPARAVFEAMGWRVELDPKTRMAEATRDLNRVVVRAGSSTVTVSGNSLTLKDPCSWRNDDVMVPAEVYRLCGAEVVYDARVGLVKVLSPEMAARLGRENLGPFGATVMRIAATPGGERVYIATIHNGLYVSSDRGMTWEHLGLEGGFPQMLAVNPSNPQVVFYSNGYGLDRSADGGRTWTGVKGLPDLFTMTFDPTGKTAYAAYAEGSMIGGSTVTLYRSTDGGLTWARTGSSVASYLMGDIVVHPRTGALLLGSGCSGVESGAGRVKVSTDGGRTWNYGPVEGVLAFAASPDGSVVYSAGLQGIWSTRDGGLTWAKLDPGIAPNPYVAPVLAAGSVLVLAEQGGEAAVSDDGGASWRRVVVPSGIPHAVCSDGQDIYLACGDHLWKSPDSGATWVSLDDGLACTTIYATAAAPGGMPRYACSPTREFWRRGDDGRWGRLTPTGFPDDAEWEVARLVQDPGNADSVFAIVVRGCLTPWVRAGDLYHSSDAGMHWSRLEAFPDGGVSAVVFDPHRPGTLWVALAGPSTAGGVHVSRDGGKTFTPAGLLGTGVTDVAIGPSGSVWAGTADGVWVKTTDDAAWASSIRGLSGHYIRRIAADPFDARYAYAVTDGGVSVTSDAGETWKPSDPGYPWSKGVPWYEDLCEIVAHPGREGLVLLRGNRSGLVWYSRDRGGTWFEVPGLNPGIEVVGLSVAPGTGVFVLTNGAGIIWVKELPLDPGAATGEWPGGREPERPALPLTWTRGQPVPGRYAWSWVYASGAHAFMKQDMGRIMASSDGLNWEASRIVEPGRGLCELRAVAPLAGEKAGVAYGISVEHSERESLAVIVRTIDGGDTWEETGEVPGKFGNVLYSVGGLKGLELAASGSNPDNLVLVGWIMSGSGGRSGAYFSNDGGRTWAACRGLPGPSLMSIQLLAGPGGAAEFLAYSAATTAFYRSGDGGRTFTRFTSSLPETSDCRVGGIGPDRIYLGRLSLSYEGRAVSETRFPANIEDRRFRIIAVSRERAGWLLGGYHLPDGRFFRIHLSTDWGKTWRAIAGEIGNPAVVSCAFLSGDRILLATQKPGTGVQTWVARVNLE